MSLVRRFRCVHPETSELLEFDTYDEAYALVSAGSIIKCIELVNVELEDSATPVQEDEIQEDENVTEECEREVIGVCMHCGKELFDDDMHGLNAEGEKVCEDCLDEYYFRCYHCREYHLKEECTIVNEGYSDVHEVCQDCLDYYEHCDECGKWFTRNRTITDEANEVLCDDCYDEYYQICETCGRFVHNNDVHWDDGDAYYSECYREKRIHVYGFKSDPNFLGIGPLFMGVELEIDKGSWRNDCARKLYDISADEGLFYLKADGSLTDEGIEIVTHPCSLNYHLNEFPWKDIAKIARENGYISHDAGTCGLHVHVSRKALRREGEWDEDAAIAKIILLVDRFWDQLTKFSRRDIYELNRWAKKPNADITASDSEEMVVEKAKDTQRSGRYQAVNLQNWDTIEFRLFRGTLNVNTIHATLQFVKCLCDFAKESSIDYCMECAWSDIVEKRSEYPELNDYLTSRDL